jgi:hypothetical protein
MTNTESDTVNKTTTQYIQRNIAQRFVDTWLELSDSKVPPQLILQGLSIAFAQLVYSTKEAQNSGKAIAKIIDDVNVVIVNSIKDGVNFPSQAAALAMIIPGIFGIDMRNLEDDV